MEPCQSDRSQFLGLRLDTLEAPTRAAHCLRAAGIDTVGTLVTLRSSDILRWPNAGRKTLNDISRMLGKLGLALTDEKVLPGVVDEQLPSIGCQATSLDTCQADRNGVLDLNLDALEVTALTVNCLRHAGVPTIGALTALRSSDILQWPNSGRKALADIRLALGKMGLALTGEKVLPGVVQEPPLSIDSQATSSETRRNDRNRALEIKLDDMDLSARAAHCLRTAGIDTIGALVTLQSSDILRWPNSGRKTLTEISLLLRKLGLTLTDENVLPGVVDEQLLPINSKATSLEEELDHLVTTIATGRNARILVMLWGWNGKAPRTLDSVGKEFSLSRERVRQIEKRALGRLRKYRFEMPLLHDAIRAVRDAVPDIESALDAKLRACGLSQSEFGIDSLQSAAVHLGIKWPFEYMRGSNERVFVVDGEGTKCRKAILLLRNKTSERGCVNVLNLASELQWDEDKLPALRRILDVASDVEWLDDSHNCKRPAKSPC